MKLYEKLLLQNKAWAAEMVAENPQFFEKLSKLQTPNFLWIGCSDSRVPANQVTGTQPGEVFVHRNIANLVVEDDLNVLSVLEYAVVHLKIQHIIICGHYGCGGVKAALTDQSFGIIDPWLKNIKNVIAANKAELDSIKDEDAKADRLVELNVKQQVLNIANTETVKTARNNGAKLDIHGWVYGLKDGIIKTVYDLEPELPKFAAHKS